MGIKIVLEDERGGRIATVLDPTNILHRVLPRAEDPSYRLVRYIDWYGDTVFNQLQISEVIEELQRLHDSAQEGEERELLARIIELAVRSQEEPHLYLKFYGD